MKRCAAIAIWRAIKELRRARKNTPSPLVDLINLDIQSLSFLLFREHQDLLDAEGLRDVEAFIGEKHRTQGIGI